MVNISLENCHKKIHKKRNEAKEETVKSGGGDGYYENYHYLGISQSAGPAERAEEFSG